MSEPSKTPFTIYAENRAKAEQVAMLGGYRLEVVDDSAPGRLDVVLTKEPTPMANRYFRRPRPELELEILSQLVAIRKSRGFTAHRVARIMNCTQAAVSLFETSAKRGHSVTLERLLRYAQAVGADIHITPTEVGQ